MPIPRENPCAEHHQELALMTNCTSLRDVNTTLRCNRCGETMSFEAAVRNDERTKIARASAETAKALAWLVVGNINEHYPHPDEPLDDGDPGWFERMGTSGCVKRCGPCGGLHTLAQTEDGRRAVEDAVRLTGFHEGGWCYWDSGADKLRWDWFEAYWAAHKACWSSGDESGCDYPDDDGDGDLTDG